MSSGSTPRSTRIIQTDGTMTFTGGLVVGGTAGTTISTLGGANSAGMGNYVIDSALTGTGTLEKAGAGTLFSVLRPQRLASRDGCESVVVLQGSKARCESPPTLLAAPRFLVRRQLRMRPLRSICVAVCSSFEMTRVSLIPRKHFSITARLFMLALGSVGLVLTEQQLS